MGLPWAAYSCTRQNREAIASSQIRLPFKVLTAELFGDLIGEISYQSNYQKKLMADPNSLLGRDLRQRQGLTLLEPTDPVVIDMIRKPESLVAADINAASGYDLLRLRNRQY